MESLRQVLQNKLSESESKCQKLEGDNIELYTKLKYLQSNQNPDPYPAFNQVRFFFTFLSFLSFLMNINCLYRIEKWSNDAF